MIILKTLAPFALVVIPKYILDEIIALNRLNIIIKYLLFMAFFNFIINFLIQYFEPLLNNRIHHLRTKLSNEFSSYVLNLDYEYLEDPNILDKKQKAIEFIYGSNGLESFTFNIESIVVNIGQVIGYTYLIISINPYIVLMIFCGAIINAKFQAMAEKYSYEAEMEMVRPSRMANYIDYICSDQVHIKDIRFLGIEKWLLNKKKESNKIKLLALDKVAHKYIHLGIVTTLTSNILNIFFYSYLIYSLYTKQIIIGDFVMYLSAITNFSLSLSNIFVSMAKFLNINYYLENYMEFVSLNNKINRKNIGMIVELNRAVIEFVNVSFKYPNHDTFVLRNITFSISTNDKISIVGENGAGKTTFIKLLLRLYDPTEGEILLNGRNIKEIDYELYRKYFSTVFQDYKLFAFSFKENVSLNNSDTVSDDEILDILNKVGLEDKVNSSAKGLFTGISRIYDDLGTDLSGGEGQRLAIARALFINRPIVILDEPTSALDPIAEYQIYQKFDTLVKNKTSVYISHRLASTKFSDKIAVFDNGEIIEVGNHDKLMKLGGKYRSMFNMQAENYNDNNKEILYE
ncbi:MAG: ABC transporter ATP-binding protein [Spirochaetales bacterium]|nr:ABC transporter ATP-binding protein [Spirochaetales bacterium]